MTLIIKRTRASEDYREYFVADDLFGAYRAFHKFIGEYYNDDIARLIIDCERAVTGYRAATADCAAKVG